MGDIRRKSQYALTQKTLNQKGKRVFPQPGHTNLYNHFIIPRHRAQQLNRHRAHRRQYIKTH